MYDFKTIQVFMVILQINIFIILGDTDVYFVYICKMHNGDHILQIDIFRVVSPFNYYILYIMRKELCFDLSYCYKIFLYILLKM